MQKILKEMFRVLVKQKRFVFNRMFSIKQKNTQEVVTAFSGLLELSRRNKVQTSQDEIFGDIVVEKKVNKSQKKADIQLLISQKTANKKNTEIIIKQNRKEKKRNNN